MELRIKTGPTVTIEREVAMQLVVGHLNTLGEERCCDTCCGMCWALRRLMETEQLDDICRPQASGWSWWDKSNNRINRELLKTAWSRTDCHAE